MKLVAIGLAMFAVGAYWGPSVLKANDDPFKGGPAAQEICKRWTTRGMKATYEARLKERSFLLSRGFSDDSMEVRLVDNQLETLRWTHNLFCDAVIRSR